MLRRLIPVLALLMIFLGGVQVAFAHDVLQGDECTVAANERIEGNVFALCRILTISGEIDGNLFGAASTIVIDGSVTDSVYAVGGQLDVSGSIGQDVHFAGGALNILPAAQFGSPTSDLITVNLSTQVDNAGIPGSITSVGYQLVLNGAVDGEVSFWGSALVINSTVVGNVTASVGDPSSTGVSELRTLFNFLPYQVELQPPGLTISDKGMVNGQVRYSALSAGNIAVELPNPPIFTQVANQNNVIAPELSFAESLLAYMAQAIREFISLILIGVIGLLLFASPLQAPIYNLRVRPLPSLGVGLLVFIISFPAFFIVVPLFGLLLVLALSVLQLSDLALIAGLIILLLDLGGAGLFYFIAIFVSRVVVCIALGRIILRMILGSRSEHWMNYINLLVGVALLALLSSLPYVGLWINALAAFTGLGAIILRVLQALDEARQRSNTPMNSLVPEEARQLPPPVIEDKMLGPGMDNLPDGFQWWK